MNHVQITKSTRHSKIAGDFGEALVLYWLSKHGFECARVDHTGIDLIAHRPDTTEVMGISVKSRTRTKGTEGESVTIPAKDFEKIQAACAAFGCSPYLAVVVDAASAIKVLVTSLAHFLELCPRSKSASYWKMSKHCVTKYEHDPQVMAFRLSTQIRRWWE
jgi:Holliday junction resolvase-like predicted endonuclease